MDSDGVSSHPSHPQGAGTIRRPKVWYTAEQCRPNCSISLQWVLGAIPDKITGTIFLSRRYSPIWATLSLLLIYIAVLASLRPWSRRRRGSRPATTGVRARLKKKTPRNPLPNSLTIAETGDALPDRAIGRYQSGRNGLHRDPVPQCGAVVVVAHTKSRFQSGSPKRTPSLGARAFAPQPQVLSPCRAEPRLWSKGEKAPRLLGIDVRPGWEWVGPPMNRYFVAHRGFWTIAALHAKQGLEGIARLRDTYKSSTWKMGMPPFLLLFWGLRLVGLTFFFKKN